MAENWYPLYSYRTVQVFPGNLTEDVERVTFQTTPSGIVGTVPIPHESWVSGAGAGTIDSIAVALENLVTYEHVVAGSPGQDLDLNNLTVDFIALTVEYKRSTPGLPPLYGTVNVPLASFYLTELGIGGVVPAGTVSPQAYCHDEYARLEALAAA